jgi:hypothetical protein
MITFSTLKMMTLNILQKLRQPDSRKLILVRAGRVPPEVGNGCSTQGNFESMFKPRKFKLKCEEKIGKMEFSVNSEVGFLMLN